MNLYNSRKAEDRINSSLAYDAIVRVYSIKDVFENREDIDLIIVFEGAIIANKQLLKPDIYIFAEATDNFFEEGYVSGIVSLREYIRKETTKGGNSYITKMPVNIVNLEKPLNKILKDYFNFCPGVSRATQLKWQTEKDSIWGRDFNGHLRSV